MLKNYDFRQLWLGRLISNAGDSIYYILLSWYILESTNSAFWVGICNFAIFIPNIFSFIFGHYIDTHKKKNLLIICELGQLIAVFMLTISIYFKFDTPFIITVLAFLAATFGMNTYTIQDALTPKIVKKSNLPKAQTYMSFAYNGTEYLFNAITGFLLTSFSIVSLLLINIGTFILSIFTFSKIKYNEKLVSVESNEDWKSNIFKGFKLILNTKEILILTCCGAFGNFLFGGMNVYQVLIANEQNSPIILGLMASAMAIGTLIGSTIVSSILLKYLPVGKCVFIGSLFFGIFLFISRFFVKSVLFIPMLGVSCVFLGINHVVNPVYEKVLIPQEHLGKVASALYTISIPTLPLGALFFGAIATKLSSEHFMGIFGVTYILISIVYLKNKSIFNFKVK